jgi:phospholipid/cholesterol/gamma-HCH transport system substrate-binding protein
MRHAIRSHLRDFLAVLGVLVIGVAAGVTILSNQGFRFPLLDEQPKRIQVELGNAQAVAPGRGQTVRVAGVEIGKIAGTRLEDGIAVVDLDLEQRYADLIREDASALLRPKTPLKDMFLEVDPGRGPVLAQGGRIRLENTAPDVDLDEILGALDADTRPYLKLLVAGAGKGLRGRGEDLRKTLRRLEPLHRDLARVTRATAARRRALKRLVHNYGLLTAELGRRPGDLRRLVGASGAVFSALAGEDDDISTAAARLPGALRRSATTLDEVGGFARELRPTLAALRPPIRRLAATNRAVRPFLDETTPIIRDSLRPFARAARPWTSDLRVAAVRAARATPDVTRSLGELNRFFNMGAYNPGGAQGLGGLSVGQQRAREEGFLYWLAWTAQNGVSLFNTADGQGPWRRVSICGLSPGLVTGLVIAVLSRARDEAPALVDELAGPGLIPAPGTPAALLQQSEFGSCSYDDLPTTPAP